MLSERGRKPAAVVIEPIARTLHGWGLSPNVVTIAGTCTAVALALWLIPTGHHFAAAVLLGLSVATDMVDGTMARMRGGGTTFGATLDATCDRISDGAIFSALIMYFVLSAPEKASIDTMMIVLCLVIVVASQVTSYVKARAEASGIPVNGGLIERPERLIIGLGALGISGLGVPYVLQGGIWILALGSAYTVIQRLLMTSRSENADNKISAPAGAKEYSVDSQASAKKTLPAAGEKG